MQGADELRHDGREERVVASGVDEGLIVWKKRWIEAGFNARDVEAAVLGEWVVAVDEQGAESERNQDRVAKEGSALR